MARTSSLVLTGAASRALLRELAELRLRFGEKERDRRLALIQALRRAELPGPEDVLQLHELLLFVRAYPDDAEVLAAVDDALLHFGRRKDLRRFRAPLENSGIAGTIIRYHFFQPTAAALARRHPTQLFVDWKAWAQRDELPTWLSLLVPYSEAALIDEHDMSPRAWLKLLAGEATDGTFLAQRFAAMEASAFVREKLYDQLGPALYLKPGEGTPNRTLSKAPGDRAPFYQRGPLASGRPDLRASLAKTPLSVREVSGKEAQHYVGMVQEAMVTRSRDLDAFAYADARDVRVVELDEGFSIAVIGVIPERRLLLECVYGALTMKNGVPIGYVLFSSLFGSTEVAFNVFDTFSGAEAAWVLGRVLAAAHRLFGSTTFSIDPYQLGHFGNEEGLRSGAFWFYYKLGFRPRDAAALRLVRSELAAMKRDPAHRSSLATLEALSATHVFFEAKAGTGVALGGLSPGAIGERVTESLGAQFGAARERGVEQATKAMATLLGVRTFGRWTVGEKQAFERFAPVLATLPELEKWSASERRAVIEVLKKKGGQRESDYVHALEAHPKLRRALLGMATVE